MYAVTAGDADGNLLFRFCHISILSAVYASERVRLCYVRDLSDFYICVIYVNICLFLSVSTVILVNKMFV